jgi:hypothetical protein
MTSFLRTRKDRHPRTEAKTHPAEGTNSNNANINQLHVADAVQPARQDHISRTINSQQSEDVDNKTPHDH